MKTHEWRSVSPGVLEQVDLETVVAAGQLATRDSGEPVAISQMSMEVHAGQIVWEVGQDGAASKTNLEEGSCIQLRPGEVKTILTDENFDLPLDAYGRIYPKGRMTTVGILLASTNIDPGFRGHLSLTLVNASRANLQIPVMHAIAKIEVVKLTTDARMAYSGGHSSATKSVPLSNELFDMNKSAIGRARCG